MYLKFHIKQNLMTALEMIPEWGGVFFGGGGRVATRMHNATEINLWLVWPRILLSSPILNTNKAQNGFGRVENDPANWKMAAEHSEVSGLMEGHSCNSPSYFYYRMDLEGPP